MLGFAFYEFIRYGENIALPNDDIVEDGDKSVEFDWKCLLEIGMLVTVRIFKNILIENRFLEFANNLSYCMSIEVCAMW